jgi:hypothetical protein
MKEKIRKTPEEIKNEILSQLKSGPKTIAEIGENIGSNWLTTEKFLNELKDEGKISELVSSPKMKIYKRIDDLAFYGLPFSEKIRNNTASLLFTIADKYQADTKKSPSKTIIQKIAVEFIEKSDGVLKEIPVLKFHYGKTLALSYDESFKNEYKLLSLTSTQKILLSKLIDEYKDMSSHSAQLKQYQGEDMIFYKIKEENFVKSLLTPDYKNIENSLLKLSIYYPIELENTFELFDRFIYCSVSLLNLSTENERKYYLSKIKEIFYLLWDTITTNYFFFDAEKHIESNKKELFNQIKINILNSKMTNLTSLIDDLESEVNSINPEKISKESSDKSQKFLHELLED